MNMIKRKRGRPAKTLSKQEQTVIDDFASTLAEWDRKDNEVDFKDLCQKLQEALARSYVEAEEFEKQIAYWRNEVFARDIVIRYLEGRK
jgi:predicted HAD superfamily phosphohydrolase YqeG